MAIAIVPAAGASRRMGRPKPLLPFAGTSMLGAVAAALEGGGARQVVVALAPDADAIRRHVDDLGLRSAVNPEPERGMLSSVVAGLEELDGGEAIGRRGEPLLICPADLPALTAATVRAVVEAVEEGALLAVPVHGGQRGHPLGIAASLVSEIETLDPAVGLRQLLERYSEELVEVEVDDPGAVRDADTDEDYRELLGDRLAEGVYEGSVVRFVETVAARAEAELESRRGEGGPDDPDDGNREPGSG